MRQAIESNSYCTEPRSAPGWKPESDGIMNNLLTSCKKIGESIQHLDNSHPIVIIIIVVVVVVLITGSFSHCVTGGLV